MQRRLIKIAQVWNDELSLGECYGELGLVWCCWSSNNEEIVLVGYKIGKNLENLENE